jgi:hypothetical protein
MADLRQMPLDEFAKLIDGASTPTQANPIAAPTANEQLIEDLPPATKNALLSASDVINRGISPDLQSDMAKRMGVRPGTFLNISQGAPASVRLKLGLDENQLNQFKLLNEQYGPGNVDLSDDGRFILRNQKTAGGQIEDVMVDPIGVDTGDLAQIAAQTGPMIAGAVLARYGMRLGGGPVTKVLAGATGAAVGQEGAGFVQDAMVRLLRGNEVNTSELAKHRLAAAITDEVFGLAAAGGAKAMSKALEGIAGMAQIPIGTTATTEAAGKLARQTGIEFPLTPGQRSESKILLRLESMIGERIGTAGAMDRMRAAQQDAEDELRRVFLGVPRTMTDDELQAVLPHSDIVGQQGLNRLGSEALRLEGNVAKTGQAVQQTGTAESQAIAGVDLKRPLNVTEIGKFAREKVTGDFAAFKDAMGKRYEEFLANPEVTARTVNGDSLAKAVSKVEKQLVPAAEKTSEQIAYDQYGNPTTQNATRTEALNAFVPSKVRSFIEELKGLRGAQVSINDLKQVRTAIDNSIAEGVAIPGTDIKQLVTLKKAVDDSITSGLQGMKDKSLLSTWRGLSSDYSKGISRFDKIGIRNMLIKEGESGSIGNTAIAESITGNSPSALDHYNDFKEFFGASSSQFKALQAGARQNVLAGSLSELTGYVDGSVLRSRLRNIRPEIAQELFGANKEELHRIGEALSKAQGKLDLDELGKLAESGSLTAAKIPDLVAAEAERATAYNNKLIGAAAKGAIDAEKIKPSEFVRFASQMDPKDAARVMGILSDNPDLVHSIRQLGIEDIWGRVKAGAAGQTTVSGIKLNEALNPTGKPVQEQTWRVILGNDTVDSLQSLADVLTKRDFATGSFKGGGRLAAATDMTRMFLKGDVGELKDIASRAVLGFLYSGPLKKSVTNLATSNDRARFLNGVIASTPFIENIMGRFGSDGAGLIMNSLRETIDPMQKRALQIDGKLQQDFDPRSLDRKSFLQWLGNLPPTPTKEQSGDFIATPDQPKQRNTFTLPK